MRILYICTHNRCRSILSEAMSNHFGEGQLIAASAGSQPVGEVHPLSLKYLSEKGIDIQNLSSKSWQDMANFKPDVVVTVCDSAQGESCPLWMEDTPVVHWGLADPSKVEGDEEALTTAFFECMDKIKQRIEQLKPLAKQGLKGAELEAQLKVLNII